MQNTYIGAVVSALRGDGRRRRKRRPTRRRGTRSIERKYTQSILPLVRGFVEKVQSELLANLRSIRDESGLRMDAPSWIERLQKILSGVLASIPIQAVEQLANEVFQDVTTLSSQALSIQISQLLGENIVVPRPSLIDIREAFVADNVGLIKTMQSRYFSDVENAVVRGLRSGSSNDSIAQNILKIGQSTESQATRIAVDQVQKAQGQIDRRSQTSIGISQYIWRTALDERVRPAHEAREGRVFSWDDPPDDGHPGEPINCRCIAEPILPA